MCVGESTKQQRVDDNVPRQTLCSMRGLLNAVTGSRYGRPPHLSASISPPLPFLHPLFLPSLSLPPDSNDSGIAMEWSPHPTPTARERESKTDRREDENHHTE